MHARKELLLDLLAHERHVGEEAPRLVFRRCGKDSAQLAEGERSCQVRLDGCRGVALTGNACRAGHDDGGKGRFTPQVGFMLKNLAYTVISGNTLHEGYMQDMIVDLGGHGPDVVIKDNVGCPMK